MFSLYGKGLDPSGEGASLKYSRSYEGTDKYGSIIETVRLPYLFHYAFQVSWTFPLKSLGISRSLLLQMCVDFIVGQSGRLGFQYLHLDVLLRRLLSVMFRGVLFDTIISEGLQPGSGPSTANDFRSSSPACQSSRLLQEFTLQSEILLQSSPTNCHRRWTFNLQTDEIFTLRPSDFSFSYHLSYSSLHYTLAPAYLSANSAIHRYLLPIPHLNQL